MQVKSYKIKTLVAVIGLFIIAVIGILNVRNKLTYIEYTNINDESNDYLELNKTGDEIVQEFVMPYDIMHGFAVKIGTFARDNNSKWEVVIQESKSNNIIYRHRFNASLIPDNEYYYIEFARNIGLKKGNHYQLHIKAISVDDQTGILCIFNKS